MADIDKAFSLGPNLGEARLDRARVLMKLNRNQDAVADLQQAAKSDPADPSAHFLLSKAYRALGRVEEARTEMENFQKLDEAARASTAERAQEVIKNKRSH